MDYLFKIVTDKVELKWGIPRKAAPSVVIGKSNGLGRLVVYSVRQGAEFNVIRGSIPGDACTNPSIEDGPVLYEHMDYQVFVKSLQGQQVEVIHRDPLIVKELNHEDNGTLLVGPINFQSQIGRSQFHIMIGGVPEFTFEVEVFPSKLDYATDYEQILADVQDIMTGLAVEYLRSTFRLGKAVSSPNPHKVEWLILLRQIVDKLTRAMDYISQHPIRKLIRQPESARVERIRKVDSHVLSMVRKTSGNGPIVNLPCGIPVQSRITENRTSQSLDTPEHRWLSLQTALVLRRLETLKIEVTTPGRFYNESNERKQQVMKDIRSMESTFQRFQKLEPLKAVEGPPPAGFISQQMLGAPGYREAYETFLMLSLGLKITDGPLNLSVKDLNLLYEYWCYFALIRLIAEETNQPIPSESLFSIQQSGLKTMLSKGKCTAIQFNESQKRITVAYNPSFGGDDYLTPQQPDILITLEDENWKHMQLVLDAKYRIDASPEYRYRYKSPGPPDDALNVLYRYRDAIVERYGPSGEPKRTIIQGAALFPYSDSPNDPFSNSKLWTSLTKGIGLGAVPLLPGNDGYLRNWIREALHKSGWSLADRVISHSASHQAQRWKEDSAKPVLIGVLKGEHPSQHLKWIEENKLYYTPLSKNQSRQFITQQVAIYSPAVLTQPGAVTHMAKVLDIDVVERSEIKTPWSPRNEDLTQKFVLYRLDKLSPLTHPIENRNETGRGMRFSTRRWTSKLAMSRAKVLSELFLETEPEWRLYENLKAQSIPFTIKAGDFRVLNSDNPRGRGWFIFNEDLEVRYDGSAGFCISHRGLEKYEARVDGVVEEILSRCSDTTNNH